jgi:hypothetical protein
MLKPELLRALRSRLESPTGYREQDGNQKQGCSLQRSDALPTVANSRRSGRTVGGDTINQVRYGEMDLRVSNAVGYLSGMLSKNVLLNAVYCKLWCRECADSLLDSSQIKGGNGTSQAVHVVLDIRCQKDRLEFANARWIGRVQRLPQFPPASGQIDLTDFAG